MLENSSNKSMKVCHLGCKCSFVVEKREILVEKHEILLFRPEYQDAGVLWPGIVSHRPVGQHATQQHPGKNIHESGGRFFAYKLRLLVKTELRIPRFSELGWIGPYMYWERTWLDAKVIL